MMDAYVLVATLRSCVGSLLFFLLLNDMAFTYCSSAVDILFFFLLCDRFLVMFGFRG